MKLPLETLPGYAMGGLVAMGQAIQHFASGGMPTSPHERYQDDPRIIRQIEDLESKIGQYNNKLLGFGVYGADLQNTMKVTPEGAFSQILKGSPESAVTNMQNIIDNLKGKKDSATGIYDDMILQASEAGNNELVNLLRSDKSTLINLAEDLQAEFETFLQEFQNTIQTIKAEEQNIIQEYEDAISQQKTLQENIKNNIAHIKQWNRSQPANDFDRIGFSEIRGEFQNISDSSWSDLLGRAMSNTEGATEFRKPKSWEYKATGFHRAGGDAIWAFFDERGQRWLASPDFYGSGVAQDIENYKKQLPQEKTGTFYNPYMLTFAQNMLGDSTAEVNRLEAAHKTALIDIANQRKEARSSVHGDFTGSMSTYRTNLSSEQKASLSEIELVKNEMQGQVDSMVMEKEDLVDDLEQFRREWEARLAELKATRTGGARAYATGGNVTGEGGVDNVPAMLTAGEYVIRKSSVDRIKSTFGSAFLDAVNNFNLPSIVHRFADGGMVQHESIQPSSSRAEKLGEVIFKAGDASLPAMVSPNLASQFIRQLKEAGYAE